MAISESLGAYGWQAMGFLYKAVMAGLVLGAVAAVALWYRREKQYNWTVRVFEKDASGTHIEKRQDKGGIILNKKTNNRLFQLKNNKFGMDPDKIPYMLGTGDRKIVYLLQTGLKNFQFLRPAVSNNPGVVFNVEDEDVAWACNAFDLYRLPSKNNILQQLLPVIGIAVLGVCFIAFIYLILDKFDVLSQTAQAFQQASKELSKASLGSQVIE